MRNNKNPPTPSIDEVEKYLAQWQRLENYKAQDEALKKLFSQFIPQNMLLNDILLKVSTLNDFYSTNIFSVYSVAKHIHSLKNVDERLLNSDTDLVDQIARVEIRGSKKYFYSFATKYCSHHNPESFPIYDYYVERMLMHFKRCDKFANFKKEDLKTYSQFKEILLNFRTYYKLEKYSLRELDRYLWLAGKDYFPRMKSQNTLQPQPDA